MLRALLTGLVCLSLAGCSGWISEKHLFGTDDWANLGLNGPYENQLEIGRTPKQTILKTRPDGLIEGTEANDGSTVGFVRIRGGSGDYFLMVNRSDQEDQGDQYYIARLSNGNTIEVFLPDCHGTSPVEGMDKVRDAWGAPELAVEDDGRPNGNEAAETVEESEKTLVCVFSTKDALMAAGLEAERFLSANHVVTIGPIARLSPADDGGTE